MDVERADIGYIQQYNKPRRLTQPAMLGFWTAHEQAFWMYQSLQSRSCARNVSHLDSVHVLYFIDDYEVSKLRIQIDGKA